MARLRISTVATIANLWLLSEVVTAQYYPRNTALNGTNTASPTKTSSSSGSVTSFFSEIQGPFLAAVSSTWTQVIIPTTVGTVMVVVNEATNETSSTTIYHTDYLKNGSSTILSRTDTDAAGTVTQVVTDYQNNQTMTVTYPTNYFEVADSLTWEAILPTVVDESTCCFETPTLSATPIHTPFVQVGSLDTEDTRGWLYTLVGVNYGDPYTNLDSTEVSSLWSGQTLGIEYDGCPYTYCSIQVSSVAPASAVQAQPGAILATSTTTISIPPASASSSPKQNSPSTSATFTPIPDQISSTPSPKPSPETTQPQSTKVSGGLPQNSAQSQTPQQSPNPGPAPENTNPAPTQPSSGPVASPNIISSAPAPTANPGLVITIGSSAISANSASQFIISGQTLAPGSSITIGSGPSTTVVALQTSDSNTVLVVGDSSSTLKPATANPPAVTVGGSVITADFASNYIIAGQTLVPGGPAINVGGTTISLAPEGTQIIEGTKTIVQTTGIGGIIWSVFGGATATASAAGNGSAATPTYVQASGVVRIQPYWAVGVLAMICSMVLV